MQFFNICNQLNINRLRAVYMVKKGKQGVKVC